jgi:hypothetical protein
MLFGFLTSLIQSMIFALSPRPKIPSSSIKGELAFGVHLLTATIEQLL